MDLPFLMWELALWPQLPKQTLSTGPVGGNKELSLQLEDFIFFFPMGLKVSKSSYENTVGLVQL